MKLRAIILVTVAVVGSSSFAADLLPPAELQAVEPSLREIFGIRSSAPLLSGRVQFSDGAKGVIVGESPPLAIFEPVPGLNEQEVKLRREVCSAHFLVLAQAQLSSSGLGRDRDMVLTKTDFVNAVALGRGQVSLPAFTVYRPGGDSFDAGQRVRYSFKNQEPYLAGTTYLLTLHALRTNPLVFLTSAETVAVDKSGVLHGRPWLNYPAGTPITEIKADIERVLLKAPCGTGAL